MIKGIENPKTPTKVDSKGFFIKTEELVNNKEYPENKFSVFNNCAEVFVIVISLGKTTSIWPLAGILSVVLKVNS